MILGDDPRSQGAVTFHDKGVIGGVDQENILHLEAHQLLIDL